VPFYRRIGETGGNPVRTHHCDGDTPSDATGPRAGKAMVVEDPQARRPAFEQRKSDGGFIGRGRMGKMGTCWQWPAGSFLMGIGKKP